MERRASIRRPVHLKAQLKIGQLHSHPCVISDYCSQGVYVQFSSKVAKMLAFAQSEEARQDISLSFSDAAVPTEYRLPIKVVRLLDGAMGARFSPPNEDALVALMRLGQVRRAADIQVGNEAATTLLQQCTEVIQLTVKPLFEQFLQELLSALLQAVERAPNDAVRTPSHESYSFFRAHSTRLANAFASQLSSTLLVKSTGSDGTTSPPDVTELSLIEKTAFEDWLTLKVMMTKAETLYRADLLMLKMRLDKIGVVSGTGYSNPLGPPLLCHAFRDVVLSLKLPPSVEKLCYRLFEKYVMKQLGELFQALNRVLIQHGVLPDLDLSRYLTQKAGPVSVAATVSEPDGTSSADRSSSLSDRRQLDRRQQILAPVAEERRQQKNRQHDDRRRTGTQQIASRYISFGNREERAANPSLQRDPNQRDVNPREPIAPARSTFSTVTHLLDVLHQVRQLSAESSLAPQNPVYWSYDEIQRGIAQLQEQRRNNPALAHRISLRRQLENNLKRAGGMTKTLPRELREAVDVVDQFFTSLMKQARLHEAAQFQIRKLELPLLKLLQRDQHLFDRKQAPILTIINRIAELGAQGGRPSTVHTEHISRLVGHLCDNLDQEYGAVDEALAELDAMLERQNLLFRRNVERVTAAAEGLQKVEDAKRLVAHELQQRFVGRKTPQVIAQLIHGGWRDLLSLTYIRQGAGSIAWQRYLEVLDQLMAATEQPHANIDQIALLQVVQEGLASISSSHMPAEHLCDALRQFLQAHQGGESNPLVEYVETLHFGSNVPAQSQPQLSEQRRRGQQRWLARVQKLRPGDWLRHSVTGDEPQYVRLAWVGKAFSRFIFVNHQGVKVLDLDQYKLVSYLQRGVVVPDQHYDQSLVDQSLETMVKDVYDQLSHATTYDAVTGLFKRKVFERHLEAVLANAGSESRHSLLYLDLRQFKLINDGAGGDAGDQALADIAGLLQANVAEALGIARFNSNEFALLLPHGDGMGQAQKLLRIVSDYRLVWKNRSYSLAANIGVVEIEGSLDASRCLKFAEKACRQAKAEGLNRVHRIHAGEGLSLQQEQMIAKIADLHGDLKSDRILLRCQKIIPLHGDAMLGTQYQVLLSVYDERGHLIPAADFVRTAERYQRMQTVDRWVVGRMLDWMALNRSKVEAMGGVSINLSGHSLNDESLLEFIFERLTQADAPIDKLCFEVTEAAAIANIHDVADFMQELREYGCKFCLGNFGSGMSSCQFLKKLPVDLIKVDGSFIRNLEQDESDQMMVRSMAEMVHFMGKELIATQVESKAALELLSDLNVDYAQGYCVEKPRLLTSF